MPRWQTSRSSIPPTCAWSTRRTRRCGIRRDADCLRVCGHRAVRIGAAGRQVNPMQLIEAKGFKIPLVGLGTWSLRDPARTTEQAIRVGYRHIDTAQMYGNEAAVGQGVRASGVKRGEVMVTTKVQPTNLAPHDLERSVKESLAHLRFDAIDLLLIHWPNPRVPLSETFGAMLKMKKA